MSTISSNTIFTMERYKVPLYGMKRIPRENRIGVECCNSLIPT